MLLRQVQQLERHLADGDVAAVERVLIDDALDGCQHFRRSRLLQAPPRLAVQKAVLLRELALGLSNMASSLDDDTYKSAFITCTIMFDVTATN